MPADIRAERRVRHEMVLQGQCRRQDPDLADIDVTKLRALGRDCVVDGRRDQFKGETVGQEVGEIQFRRCLGTCRYTAADGGRTPVVLGDDADGAGANHEGAGLLANQRLAEVQWALGKGHRAACNRAQQGCGKQYLSHDRSFALRR
jgi:hypothetical protein